MLYADDTDILSESQSDLQAQLGAFHEYCLTWKLKVNIDKTKIVIFGSGRTPQIYLLNIMAPIPKLK